jgi:hypothetical protein
VAADGDQMPQSSVVDEANHSASFVKMRQNDHWIRGPEFLACATGTLRHRFAGLTGAFV